MRQRDADPREPAAPQHVMGSKRGQYGQWPNFAWELAWQLNKRPASFPQQELARRSIAAMGSAVNDRPERTGSFGIFRLSPEQPSADPEQNAAAQPETLGLLTTPGKRLEKRKPCVLELRQ